MIATCFAALTLPILAAAHPLPAAQAAEEQGPTDPDISNVVDRELLYDHAVSPDRIDVETADGIVTLTGTVDNILSRERAARIAETVKGVRAVVNRIEVAPRPEVADADLRKAVSQALLADPAADSYEVSVDTVEEGHVVLTGTVDSLKERELAATVSKGVRGVRALTNEIVVSYRRERPDAEIASDIREALHWNALVDHGLITVAVNNGAVKLTGIVGSSAEKREALRTARTAGVESIDGTGLAVERWARDDDLRKSKYIVKSEEALRAALEAALEKDPRVAAFDVQVSTSGNAAILRGKVDNLRAKRAAEQVANNTVGVRVVYNYLKVRPTGDRSEAAIEGDVRAALLRDPFLDRSEITVQVRGDTVHLFGQVDSYFEKAQADEIASRTRGVTEVSNNLMVDDRPYAYDPYVDLWHIYGFDWYAHVPSYTYRSDEEIEAAIEDELFWSPFVDSDEVTVEVADGIATLTGQVDSWMEKGAARDNAYEGGATYVRNDLVVSSTGIAEASG